MQGLESVWFTKFIVIIRLSDSRVHVMAPGPVFWWIGCLRDASCYFDVMQMLGAIDYYVKSGILL